MKLAQLLAAIGLTAGMELLRDRSPNHPKHCGTRPTYNWPDRHKAAQRKSRRALRVERVSQSQATKPVKLRKHKQHVHRMRDAHGAYTLTGGTAEFMNCPSDPRWHQFGASRDNELTSWHGRRMWLAGISAQRGF